MFPSPYDALWDNQLQAAYKAGKRGLKANRFVGPVAVPPDKAFITMPAGKEQARFSNIGDGLLRQGKLGLIHLNGGLGTRFGQIKATHEVAEFAGRPRTFLELKIAHLLWVCREYGTKIFYGLMNSPITDPVTQEFLGQHGCFGLSENQPCVYVQSVLRRKVPRVADIEGYFSKSEEDPSLVQNLEALQQSQGEFFSDAWAPAGHFDAVAILVQSRTLGKFLDAGVEYLQISNIDNLAATVDPLILGVLAEDSQDLLVEVARKKPGDRGGIPVLMPGRGTILLEEFALPENFDSATVRQFNTATYWIKTSCVLNLFGLTPADFKKQPDAFFADRVRAVRQKIPAYTILKKADIPGVGDVLAVQDEQLLGDITRLYLEQTGQSPAYLLIDTDKRFIPVKTKEDLLKEESRIRAVLQDRILLR